jgi:hypothetical protein
MILTFKFAGRVRLGWYQRRPMSARVLFLSLVMLAAGRAAWAQPVVDLPPGLPEAPVTELPRETPVENALGGAGRLQGSAFGGYGELTLNIPGKYILDPSQDAVVDLRRFVLFFGHNFSDRVRFYSEVEFEHAVSSADDRGEAEIEQAYLDGLLGRRLSLRGGLIIMPAGIVNVYHEPPTLNGVDRPAVDTFVIPTTWREAGVGIFGELSEGLRYQLYVVNGFNANGFTAGAAIRDGHQEAQFARASDWGAIARLDWEPRLGTVVGGSGYYATSGNTLTSMVGKVPVTLFEIDARMRIGGFAARAEVAVLFIGDAAALDDAFQRAAVIAGALAPDPVASQSRGGYLEAGYDLLRWLAPGSAQGVTLFGRFDYADTQAVVPAGFLANPALRRTIYTVGLVYRPVMAVALKLDYRRHTFGAGPGANEVAAAITWMFRRAISKRHDPRRQDGYQQGGPEEQRN